MKELSKSIPRRLHDPDFMQRYFCGEGIDIGGAPDPLELYRELFPRMVSVRVWDLADGDAQQMAGVPDDSFDFVHSSHCLEHLHDPAEGLRNWLRILRPEGYLIVTMPDEDLYEQGVFPSEFNRDHKSTFTIHKARSWSPRSVNLLGLLAGLGPRARVERLALLTASYRFSLPRYDQTRTPVGECGIELVIRKAGEAEAETGIRPRDGRQPPEEVRVHLNQYRDDQRLLKETAQAAPPFRNPEPL